MSSYPTALTGEETAWVEQLTGRLRVVQADAAEAMPEKRREYLREELARSFKGVPPANQRRYKEALLARFPVAGQILQPAAPAPAPAAETFEQLQDRFLAAVAEMPAPRREQVAKRLVEAGLLELEFEQLLERFLKAAAELPAPKRQELAKRLSEEGLAPRGDGAPVILEVEEELRQRLGLPAGQPARLDGVVQLCALLGETFQRLDQAALKTMRELSPKSTLLKRPQDFHGAAVQFLAGSQESAEPQVRLVASLLGALLAALLGGHENFARWYLKRFSPREIAEVVDAESEGGLRIFGKSKKELCWNKYVALAEDFATPEQINRRIRDCLAAFVENKVLGGR
jgi:hypothetical protein